ncbi:Cytochrome P450 monooxygenase 98 [Psilocybe cubensis]|uniref:Cytochrome P450 monooxygenase 98 n=1 Tax=Psilocybe cubensis TaxID=181762 RepID=A0ACB8GKY7_PSICU|nr:Cytochrome P450 monooxygenase 98 [Psilocybe cubensis]KAH9476206.1 Cytochrome P450 monooxygenase 98 [Psilocybe cubensis]
MTSISFFHAAAFFLVVLLVYSALRRRRVHRLANPRNLPYPPGPKPLPIIGNLFDIARDNETATYQALARQYGDLVFLSALGKHILFVNSFETANQLFEKRSANYSDRIQSTMSHELMGWGFSLGHMRYGDRWRKHRRMFHHQFQQSVSPSFWPIQQREAHSLLRRLLHSPDRLDHHLRHNAAAVIMSVTYGITIESTDDKYIALAEKALEGMAKSAGPGAFLVDLMPSRTEWVPGASFKRKAREWRAAVTGMREAPFATVVADMASGKAPPSFVSNLLNDIVSEKIIEDDEIETIKNCAGIAYAASFILAVLTHPEVQEKAQKELDDVVGRERLPHFNDRRLLPYTSAVVKETLRGEFIIYIEVGILWHLSPLEGLPHMVTHDDEFNGGILNDPNLYPNPRRFDPDRFMNEGDKGPTQHLSPTDTLSVAFGYGRRFCPGRHMGEAQVWISVACILSAFNITPALDENGRPIEVVPAFSSGMIW